MLLRVIISCCQILYYVNTYMCRKKTSHPSILCVFPAICFAWHSNDSLGSDFDLRHVFREGGPRGARRIAHLATHKSRKWKMWPWNIISLQIYGYFMILPCTGAAVPRLLETCAHRLTHALHLGHSTPMQHFIP